jgi:hypothetical protein
VDSSLRHRIAPLCLAVLAGVVGLAAHRVNRGLERGPVDESGSARVGVLPDGKALRVLSLGFDRVLADLFWIRTVYYMGNEFATEAGYPDAERLAQFVTDIDPGFRTVYVVMGAGLEGVVNDPAAGRRLLLKGIEHVSYWKLHFLLGFNYFFRDQDYVRAAEQMSLAAKFEDAPPYLPLLSARLYAAGGSPETAMLFIRARIKETEDPQEREILSARYTALWIHRDLARIDDAIARYKAKQGRDPRTVQELVAAGLLDQELKDPSGQDYQIVKGKAESVLIHERLKLNESFGAGRKK